MRTTRPIRLIVIGFLIHLVLGLAAGAHAQSADAALHAAIEQRSRAFAEAYNRGDIDTVAGMYTDKAMAFPPDGLIVTGRPALRQLWQSNRDGGVQRVALHTEGVEGSGDLAIETGTGELDVRAADGTTDKQHMKFVVVWRREPDGVWRLHRDIWNGLPAPK